MGSSVNQIIGFKDIFFGLCRICFSFYLVFGQFLGKKFDWSLWQATPSNWTVYAYIYTYRKKIKLQHIEYVFPFTQHSAVLLKVI